MSDSIVKVTSPSSSEHVVIWLAASIAILDILFILVAVPESLPEKLRPASWGSQISWEKADPFGVGTPSPVIVAFVCIERAKQCVSQHFQVFYIFDRVGPLVGNKTPN